MAVKLNEFLEQYASQLAGTIEAKLTPLYIPERPEGVESYLARLTTLKRPLFRVQAEIVKGLAKAMYDLGRTRLVVCGEQGCGKTTLGLALLAVAPRPQRALVVCPSHLVEKWLREAKEVVPGITTVDLAVRNVISVLDDLRQVRTRPDHPELYVISKDRLKLSFGWKPAAWRKKPYQAPYCPRCGARAQAGDELLIWDQLAHKRYACVWCREPFWQADPKLRRYAPIEYMKHRLRRFFDLAILDEVHELKGGDTLQGQAMGGVVAIAKRILCLTGTLNGGYADDLFYLLWRMNPRRLKADGFEHAHVMHWMARYGVLEIVRDLEDGDEYQYGRGRKKNATTRKRPGVSPVVIGRHLLDKTAFIRLADVIDGLPPYEERVVTLTMDPEVDAHYRELETELRKAIREHGRRALGAMLQSLLSYPDTCMLFGEDVVVRDQTGTPVERITAPKLDLPDQTHLPKEQALLDLVARERARGRKCLIYVTFTATRDVRPRLKRILEAAGHRVGVLDAAVEPKRREAWIAAHQADIDALLVNPELVKTGLDLYAFPSVIFYQTGYNLFTLRQAARRSWRIGQRQPVTVTFLCYESTMQSVAIYLIARKLQAALLVEGDLPEGLAEYGHTTASLIEEMGKALADGRHYAGAEAAWAEFRKHEIEAQLALGAADRIEVRNGQPDSIAGPITPVSIKVSICSRRGKRESVLEVSPEDLETLASTHGAVQLAFW